MMVQAAGPTGYLTEDPATSGAMGGVGAPDPYRKDGTDWFAEYPPMSDKSIDVQLVHTLHHERYIASIRSGWMLG